MAAPFRDSGHENNMMTLEAEIGHHDNSILMLDSYVTFFFVIASFAGMMYRDMASPHILT